MSVGKILYFILFVPAIAATGIFYIFNSIAFLMKFSVELMHDLLDEVKEF